MGNRWDIPAVRGESTWLWSPWEPPEAVAERCPYERMEPGRESFPSLLLELPAAKDSVSVARHALSSVSDGLPSDVLDDLRLLVSELITNSIRHTGLGAGDLIELRVTRSPGMVRAEVADQGPGFARAAPRPLSERESGWGLFLVEQISDRWGLIADQMTRVWFELDIKPAPGEATA